jgi:hypothetical protein
LNEIIRHEDREIAGDRVKLTPESTAADSSDQKFVGKTRWSKWVKILTKSTENDWIFQFSGSAFERDPRAPNAEPEPRVRFGGSVT